MPLVNVAQILAVAWVLLSVWRILADAQRVQAAKALILLLWVAAPLPLAYWIGSRFTAT